MCCIDQLKRFNPYAHTKDDFSVRWNRGLMFGQSHRVRRLPPALAICGDGGALKRGVDFQVPDDGRDALASKAVGEALGFSAGFHCADRQDALQVPLSASIVDGGASLCSHRPAAVVSIPSNNTEPSA